MFLVLRLINYRKMIFLGVLYYNSIGRKKYDFKLIVLILLDSRVEISRGENKD